MKILILSQYWAPENGVPQRRWSWLTELLEGQEHQVTVIAPPPHYDRKIPLNSWIKKLVSDGLNNEEVGSSGELILRSPFLPAGTSLTARALNQAFVGLGVVVRVAFRTGSLKGYRPDLIIGTVPAIPISLVVWLVGKIYHRPYIVDLRDAWPDLLEQSDSWNSGMGKPSLRQRILSRGPLQLVSWAIKRAMNHSLRNARAIIATSERLAQNLEARPEIRHSSKLREIVTIRNVFPPKTEIVRKQVSGDGENSLRILYAGTIGRAQNLRNALDAVRIVKESGLDIKIRIVGSGAEKHELRKLTEDIRDAVSFEPSRPADELETYYAWADSAMVHLADWEPLERTVPSKVYELLTAGIHISAVVRGETAKLITSLNAGHVVEPNDPEALAALWLELAKHRDQLITSNEGRDWVMNQRTVVVPKTLGRLIKTIRGE